MKVKNKQQSRDYVDRLANTRRQHDEQITALEAQAPEALSLVQHPEGEAPRKLPNGIVVMPGDYYNEEQGIVIAAADIGPNGAWEEVQ